MKQFTLEEFREAFFSLPQVAGCSRADLAILFFNEEVSQKTLGEDAGLAPNFRGIRPYTYLRETFLSDAIAKLLGVEKDVLSRWAEQMYEENDRLFRLKESWTSEEWALAYLNFAAMRLPRAKLVHPSHALD